MKGKTDKLLRIDTPSAHAELARRSIQRPCRGGSVAHQTKIDADVSCIRERLLQQDTVRSKGDEVLVIGHKRSSKADKKRRPSRKVVIAIRRRKIQTWSDEQLALLHKEIS